MWREQMWFGTEDYATWIEPPLAGADSSPQAWSSDGVTLNGFGYAFNSVNSHKVYNYAWSGASTRQAAQQMRDFANGLYGTGKIYFIDPTIRELNVLPARWANPVMTADYEGPSLTPGLEVQRTIQASGAVNGLPASVATYDFAQYVTTVTDLNQYSVYVPIPEGYAIVVTAFGNSSTGNGATSPGVFVHTTSGSSLGTGVRAPLIDDIATKTASVSNAQDVVLTNQNGSNPGVRIRIGEMLGQDATGVLTIRGIQARLFPIDEATDMLLNGTQYEGFTTGMGHEGCRFVGKPTYITHNRVNGGQIEFATTLKETLF